MSGTLVRQAPRRKRLSSRIVIGLFAELLLSHDTFDAAVRLSSFVQETGDATFRHFD
jgi:hypothetical protein